MTYPLTTTLSALRANHACLDGYNKVVRMLQGLPFTTEDEERESYIRFAYKEPISLISILENNDLADAIWALRAVSGIDRDCRLFAVWCARQVEHLNTDPRVKNCNDVSERFANGIAAEAELDTARAATWAARAAMDVAWAAKVAAWAAAWDAGDAMDAMDVAWAAKVAAWAAARSVCDAADAADDDASRAAQKEMFIKMCNGTAPWQESKQ